MALFVHFTSEKNVKSVVRSGIKPGRTWNQEPGNVFAVPVTPDFYGSHQWLREIRRNGQRTICAVYFRLPDDVLVEVGHYGGPRRWVTAAQTVACFLSEANTDGWEVRVPRAIKPGEVQKVRTLRQVIGWRYMPGAHERAFCGCRGCVPPGTIRARQKNRRWEASFARS